MKLELTQKLRQEQILAPQMILSMDILLLTNMELESRIQEEFVSNPALEIAEREPEAREPSPKPFTEATTAAGDLARQEAEVFAHLEAFQGLPGMGFDARPQRKRSAGDEDRFEALSNVAGKPEGLVEHLVQQIHLLDLPESVKETAEFIVNDLDARGYLLHPPEEVRQELPCSDEEFRRAMEVVRGLEPAGVGARDLRDCLVLQLERDRQDYALEVEIIRNHLEDLRQNKLPKIAKDLGRTVEEIKEAREIITLLQPSPGDEYDHSAALHVKPEVVVEKVEGRFEILVDEDSLPTLAISESCRNLLKKSRSDPEVVKFLRRKIESAQWLIQAVRQRRRTIHDIARTITEYQRDFMEHGPVKLRAMKMQTIADIIGVHISTISRAIKGKYMQTPWGTFDMRFFFTGGVERADGQLESRRNIYREIGELISGEDKRRPLSDSDIARVLRDRGLDIARRTVTKYREQEGIPSSRLRKQF